MAWTSSRTHFAGDGPRKTIFRSHPSIGPLAKVYGDLTFILEDPHEVEAFLEEEDRFYQEFQASHPLHPEMLEPFERSRNGKVTKIA